jgi:hypothetical protein
VGQEQEDLVQPTKGLREKALNNHSAVFIKQSSRSNYCGVYSTGMLLSLIGFLTTRRQALALFNLKRSNADYPGASHMTIGNVFAAAAKVRCWRWEFHRGFNFASISRSLREHFRINPHPTLLSFGAIHKNGKWQCTHVAVVTRVTNRTIELLDPLGSRPHMSDRTNVWFCSVEKSKSIRVIGNSYSVDHQNEVAVLRWSFKELT